MTDTQEAMREEFEQWRLKRMETIRPEDDYLDSSSAWAAWQAAVAQSAEKIARLEAELKTTKQGCLTYRRELVALHKASSDVCDMVDYQLVESGQWERLGEATDSAEYFILAGEQLADVYSAELTIPPSPEQKGTQVKQSNHFSQTWAVSPEQKG